jgi:exonuclease III
MRPKKPITNTVRDPLQRIMDNLRVASYKSTGLGPGKSEFISELLRKYKINVMLLQKTWLQSRNQNNFLSINTDYHCYGVSGMRDSVLLHGKPHGGLAILWKTSLSPSIRQVSNSNKRLCALVLECKTVKLLIINVYYPVDNYKKSFASDEFVLLCDGIECLAEKYHDHILLLEGDFNVDFERCNAHDIYLKDVAKCLNVSLCWELNAAFKDFTFQQGFTKSVIDHFLYDTILKDKTSYVGVIECPFNLSNHIPICIDIQIAPGKKVQPNVESNNVDAFTWHKVTKEAIQQYQNTLDHILSQLSTVPSSTCRNDKTITTYVI